MSFAPPPHARLPPPVRDEAEVVARLGRAAGQSIDWPGVVAMARPWVQAVRDKPAPFWALESLLQEYPISSREGLALMRLAEALLRVPDVETAIALTADQLGRADFNAASADERSGSPHRLVASLSASAISLSKRFLPDAEADTGLLRRLGAQTVVAATVRAIQLLGRQFVLGRSIGEALGEAASARKQQPGLRFSYDMLGEGARTERDAERYLASYADAIAAIARGRNGAGPEDADGISIKLSALFSRYEEAQRGRVFAELVPRVRRLVDLAAAANLNLTIDAEESDRLELSLDVFEALARDIAVAYPQWRGFGLAVQAYQTRAIEAVDEVARIGRETGLRFMVRLVKGAYWDGEVKRAQEMGLAGYPVFTEKTHTDVSYLACARPCSGMATSSTRSSRRTTPAPSRRSCRWRDKRNARFEMQRLHGMGEAVYREVLHSKGSPAVPLRVYAPVGEHRDLLAYLVRRLLENGANSSFVHQLSDASVDVEALLASPLLPGEPVRSLPLPVDLYRSEGHGAEARANSRGLDLANLAEREPLERAIAATRVEAVAEASAADVAAAVGRAQGAFAAWNSTGGSHARGRAAAGRRCPRAAPAGVLRPARARGRQDARATALPRFGKRSTSAATTPTRPSDAWRRRRCPVRPARATSCICTAAASSPASAPGTSRSPSSAARSWRRSWRATASSPSRPSRRRRSPRAWWRCCMRPACRPMRYPWCMGRARASVRRLSPMRALAASASPARCRWRRRSTAAWRRAPARSCP